MFFMPDGIYDKIRLAIGKAADAGAHLNAAKISENIGEKLGLSDTMIQYTHVELRNTIYEPEFKKIPYNERILFLPHCPRHKSCLATNNGDGYECKHCGACDITKAIKLAEGLGYKKVFIVPGGSMVKKLVEKYNPKAAVGVCCFHEAVISFDMLKKTKVIPQVVLLLKDGCKDTKINLDLLEEKLKLINEDLLPKVAEAQKTL
jgi:hypothetical protein